MTSAAKRAANRRNARLSTGPKTPAGKARAAQNARRHGLTLSARGNPALACAIEALGRAIAGAEASVTCRERADRIAAAQIELIRVRQARRDILAGAAGEFVGRLASLDRYERRARARRRFAIRDFDAARKWYATTTRFCQNEPTDRKNPAISTPLVGKARAKSEPKRPAMGLPKSVLASKRGVDQNGVRARPDHRPAGGRHARSIIGLALAPRRGRARCRDGRIGAGADAVLG